jgi:hypothetical protein
MLAVWVLHQFFDGAGDASSEYADGSNLRVLVYQLVPAPLRAASHYYRGADEFGGDTPTVALDVALFRPLWRSGTRRR